MFVFNPYQKILFSLFTFFMSGIIAGIAAFNADIEGITTKTVVFIAFAVVAIILSVLYLVTVLRTVVVEDKLKKLLKDNEKTVFVPSPDGGLNFKE